MNKKKVLIISYYWPPAGGPGVQRWLKFAKYLPEFDVEPVIYTPENPSYPIVDKTLLNEIPENLKQLKTKIWEPYRIAELFNSKSADYKAGHFEKSEKQSVLTKLLVYVRGNFFIPDARKFWIKPSVKFLSNYLKHNPVDVVISTGPPHSMHLIGKALKEQNPNFKWLADFRDPWTQISYHSELKLSKNAKNKHIKLEKSVMQSADCLIATSYTDAENYKKIGAKRVEVITNGFEYADFEQALKKRSRTSKFRITYSGGLEIARNPVGVWKALQELVAESQEFKSNLELVFYGNLSEETENSIKEHSLSFCLNKKGYVSHSESIQGIVNSELLLLCNFPDEKSKGIIPGKLFEYLATQNPILATGPDDADVEKILQQTGSGEYFLNADILGIKNYIAEIYKKRKGDSSQVSGIDNFSRKSLSAKLAGLIKDIA